PFSPSKFRVRRVDGDARPRAFADAHGGAEVVAVGEDDASHALSRDLLEDLIRHLRGIDADVSLRVADEPAVEVVALPGGEPRPGEDAGEDLSHAVRVHPPRRFVKHPRRFRYKSARDVRRT